MPSGQISTPLQSPSAYMGCRVAIEVLRVQSSLQEQGMREPAHVRSPITANEATPISKVTDLYVCRLKLVGKEV